MQTKVPEVAPQAETQLQTPPRLPETVKTIWQKVQSMATDLQRIDGTIQALSEMTILMAAARDFGIYKRENCPCEKDGLCALYTWANEDEIPQGMGEPILVEDEEPEWYIKPSPFYCAVCTAWLESRLDDVESGVSDNPLSGAKSKFTCDGCGSKGWIAVAIQCTKCGRETHWGWFPEQ